MIKRIYNYIFNKPKIKDKLIGIVRIENYSSYYFKNCIVAYHLFESSKGRRYYKAHGFDYAEDERCTNEFVTIIQPWLDGLDLPNDYKINI